MEDYNDEDPPCTDTFEEEGVEGEFFVDIGLGLDDITSNDLDEVVDAREISELIKLWDIVPVENRPPIGEEERVEENEPPYDKYQNDPNDFLAGN
jgi:hypothetical protein